MLAAIGCGKSRLATVAFSANCGAATSPVVQLAFRLPASAAAMLCAASGQPAVSLSALTVAVVALRSATTPAFISTVAAAGSSLGKYVAARSRPSSVTFSAARSASTLPPSFTVAGAFSAGSRYSTASASASTFTCCAFMSASMSAPRVMLAGAGSRLPSSALLTVRPVST